MNLDAALQTFYVESRELLEQMETALLVVSQEVDTAETVNAIFRAAHTIKGSAGLFGLDRVVEFTHVVESLLDEVREATLASLNKISDAALDTKTTGPMAAFAPNYGSLYIMLGNHMMMHVGQFTVLRRKLGKPVLF